MKNTRERQERLREIIIERKRKMWNELRGELFQQLGEEHHAQFEVALDVGDQGLADLIEDTGLTIADVRRQELTLMADAERRLQEGTYGTCDDCGTEISEERLQVVPYALYCVKCQEKREAPPYPPGKTL